MVHRIVQVALAGLLIGEVVSVSPALSTPPDAVSIQVFHAQVIDFEQQGDDAFWEQRDYTVALEYYNQALEQIQDSGDSLARARLFTKRGETYRKLSNADAAIADYQMALLLLSNDDNGKNIRGDALNGLGLVYIQLGEYEQAETSLEQALAIRQQISDRTGQGFTLNNLGLLAQNQAIYINAIDHYSQAAAIFAELNQPVYQEIILSNLGLVQLELGQYAVAQDTLNQALALNQAREDRYNQGIILHNIGLAYGLQQDYGQARKYYIQALALRQEVGDHLGEQRTLNNLGFVSTELGDHHKAITYLESALTTAREQNSIEDEANILDSLGTAYQNLGQYEQAWTSFNQALVMRRAAGLRRGEAITLRNLGKLFDQQDQSDLAIIFYKQSVDSIEIIKQDLQSLSIDFQQPLFDIFEETYRRLAELLLDMGKSQEAQQVIDLLKVHEIDSYLKDVHGEESTHQLNYWQLEREILALYETSIQSGQELIELRNIPYHQLTSEQKQRLSDLVQQEIELLGSFNEFLDREDVKNAVRTLQQTSSGPIDPEQLNSVQDDLQQLNQNAVLLYPLILDDHLELLLVTPFAPPVHYPVNVTQAELEATISEFRQALSNRNSQPELIAQRLYQWLIAPIEQELEIAQAQTIVYAPDRSLRYVPLAALHDGNQWLAERYRINHITAASLTDLTERSTDEVRLLAAAFADASSQYRITIDDKELAFAGLPYAGLEINSLAELFPETTQLIDADFSRDATIPLMGSHTVVHLATHAAFVPSDPYASFVMFGNGDRVTIADVRKWNLRAVDLVILSACETGLTGFGYGKEILGFGYQMQRTGARAAIASLWPVSDGGTQELMTNFYKALRVEGMTKAEALQQAQIALITGNQIDASSGERFSFRPRHPDSPETLSNSRLSHPYYWAPFILIGNGL